MVRVVNYEFPDVGEDMDVTRVTVQPVHEQEPAQNPAATAAVGLPSALRTAPPPPPPPGEANEENAAPAADDAPLAAPPAETVVPQTPSPDVSPD
jgi:hypothetical protein